MVEAAGIEPASEKARHEKTTCVSDSLGVGDDHKNRRRKPSLSPIDLDPRLRTEAYGLSCHKTLTSFHAGLEAGTAT